MQDEYIRIIIDIPKDTYEYVIEGAETSHDEIIVMDAIRNSNIIDTNNEFHNTIYGMISDDYKGRFKAEYQQVKIRKAKLNKVIDGYYKNTLSFKLDTPIELLHKQYDLMSDYLFILGVRAKIEGINLD